MVKIGEIFSKCEEALGDAMRTLWAKRPDYFLLYLARGEYNASAKGIQGVSAYMTDYTMDLHNIHYQQRYIIRYLDRNYKREGFDYQNEKDVNDLITEMLIYSHIWEDIGYLKLLIRLAELLDGKDYDWSTDIEYHSELYETIHKRVIEPLKNQKLGLGELIEAAYSSHIRNAFAHSMYSIYYESRTIEIWGGRSEDKSWRERISFEDFQMKFLKTIRIWNQLYHWHEECRKAAATDKMCTNWIPLPDGKCLQLRAVMLQRGDRLEPSFRGEVAKNKRN